jgi:hypothetical protein
MKVAILYGYAKERSVANIDKFGYIVRFNLQLSKENFVKLQNGETIEILTKTKQHVCTVKLYNKKEELGFRESVLGAKVEAKVDVSATYESAVSEVEDLREELNRMTILMASLLVKG